VLLNDVAALQVHKVSFREADHSLIANLYAEEVFEVVRRGAC
jgi:hypothetical protein